ncbi:hypothetical protein NQ314_002347 [Rhamnusium bicolor]|uniref:Protein artemis n=1 Tax=Rhamnusium bicolor TaxID=1586634 RepID=A0AAV8ZRR1_9CUCU|nr:hypothetical protein NQ314_002347 [Rhamnusium bicolor]
MSTFSGKIQEIPNISVDRFDDNNLQSEAYFLSHCHYDHMIGLNRDNFQNILINNNKFLYVSDVSCEILTKMYPKIRSNIKVLDMYTPTSVMLKDKNISVIPLPAGHCPGSVMFLFEGNNTCILYTGDYRINKGDFKKFKSFYNSFNEVKAIDKIYLDTTFFLKRYLKFPKREESLNELCNIIKEWTCRDKYHIVKLVTSAKYGYEYAFNEIYKKVGMPVHVNRDIYEFYSIIPEMDNSVTVDGALTQIHSSCGTTYQSMCSIPLKCKLKIVKISAIRWQQDKLENGLSFLKSDIHYLCYSTHASYEEGVELIKFLKPKSIEACVMYNDPYNNVEIMKLIQENLEELKREEAVEDKPKLFETKAADTETVSSSLESDSCPFNDDFGILDSPPRKNVQKDKTDSEAATNEVEENIVQEVTDEVSYSVENESTDIGILDSSLKEKEEEVLCKSRIDNLIEFEKKKKIEGEIEEEKVYNLSNESSSCSDDIVILDSPPRVSLEEEILKKSEPNLVNDIIESPPRKKLK